VWHNRGYGVSWVEEGLPEGKVAGVPVS